MASRRLGQLLWNCGSVTVKEETRCGHIKEFIGHK